MVAFYSPQQTMDKYSIHSSSHLFHQSGVLSIDTRFGLGPVNEKMMAQSYFLWI